MSTIGTNSEDLILNADGSGSDIKFKSNGTEVGSISDAGVMTATSFSGSGANLTNLPADSTKLPLAGGTMTGALELSAQNSGGVLNKLTFTDTDTGTAPNQVVGSIEFNSSDTGNTGVGAKVDAIAEDYDANMALRFFTGDPASATEKLKITNDGRGLSQFTAKAWINLHMGNGSIRDSHNHDSVTDVATGQFVCSFTVNMSNSNYVVTDGIEQPHSGGHSNLAQDSFRLFAYNSSASGQDVTFAQAVTYGD